MNRRSWVQWLDSFLDDRKSKACPEPRRRIQNLKRVGIFSIGVTIASCGDVAQAQLTSKVPRVGILRIGSPPDPLIEGFRDELSKLGYLDGQSIAIENRYTRGKEAQLRDRAADLVSRKVDVIIAPGGTVARIAKDATHTIPIVIIAVADPVGEGLVSSLARYAGVL